MKSCQDSASFVKIRPKSGTVLEDKHTFPYRSH